MKSQILGAYFAVTLNTESLLRKSTTLENLEQLEKMPQSYLFAPNTTEVIQVSMEWGKRLLLGTMEFLRRIC